MSSEYKWTDEYISMMSKGRVNLYLRKYAARQERIAKAYKTANKTKEPGSPQSAQEGPSSGSSLPPGQLDHTGGKKYDSKTYMDSLFKSGMFGGLS